MKLYTKSEQDAYEPECPLCRGPATVEWVDAEHLAWLDDRNEPMATPTLTCIMQCWSWIKPDFATMPRVWELRTMAALMFPELSDDELSATLRAMSSEPMYERPETHGCPTCHLETTNDKPPPRGFFACAACDRFVDPIQSGLWTCPQCRNESLDANWNTRQRSCPSCAWSMEKN